MKINKLAADTCYWPLYEVVDGKYKITYKNQLKITYRRILKTSKNALNTCLILEMSG